MENESKIIVNDDYVILKKSVYSHFFKLVFFIVFYFIWYSTLLANLEDIGLISFVSLIFFLAPLFSVFEMIRSIKVIAGGDVFYFNKKTQEIFQDKNKIGNFSDIDYIQIRTISGESSNDYRLSLVFKNEKKSFLEQSKNYEKICEIADYLSDVLDVSIKRKGYT